MPKKGYKQTKLHKSRRKIFGNEYFSNHKHTNESKEKIWEKLIRHKTSDETKEKQRIAAIGNQYSVGLRSKETRERMRIGAIGNQNSKGHKGNGLTGKHWKHSDEAKKNMVEPHLKENLSEETLSKMRDAAIVRIQKNNGPYKDTKPELKMKEIFIEANLKFKHQVRIKGISHIFDFGDEENKVLVEVDGRYFHTLPGRREKDYKINRLAKKLGYKVIRFWDKDIMNNEEKIIKRLEEGRDGIE